ncbi:MAG: AI-2E family transporter [Actinomycetaceae bacterium]|nr:AI-2E family transporter [Actinomycetaceae bacterium]
MSGNDAVPQEAATHVTSAPPKKLRVSTKAMPTGTNVLMILALATIAGAGLYQIRGLFAPAFFALTLVLTVRPVHRYLLRHRMPGWFSALTTIFLIIFIVVGILGATSASFASLPGVLQSYSYKFEALMNDVFQFMADKGISTHDLREQVMSNFSASTVLSTLSSLIDQMSSALSILFVIVLAIFFVTIDTLQISSRSNIVKEHDESFFDALSSFENRVRQYWFVSSLFGAIVAIFDGIALYILDVPMPMAWALLAFVTNYIPNIGFIIGLIPPALLGLVDSGWITAVWIIVIYSALNSIIQGVIQPKITGDTVGLSATTTFISLLFWAIVIGPMGTILAVPLTLFAKAILVDSSPQTRWIEAFLVPESEAMRKKADGYYNETEPTADTFIDFATQIETQRTQTEGLSWVKKIRERIHETRTNAQEPQESQAKNTENNIRKTGGEHEHE